MEEAMPRRFKIGKKDLLEHGYTSKCPGCSAILKNLRAQGHSEACRKRIEIALKGSEKLNIAGERIDELMAKAVE